MLRKLLGAGVLLATLAGCTELEGTTCTQDSDCGEGQVCNTSLGRCFKEPEIPSTECTPACADYQACTATGCKSRFTGLTILTPAANAIVSGGTVQVQAQLKVDPAYAGTTTYPDTLMFSATRSDGAGNVGSFGAVTRTDNTYTVDWTPPTGQTQVTLSAAHPTPAAVQSGSVTVQLDTVAPTFTISFSNPPTRATGTAGTQADERDPTTGFDTAFRRDESVTVTISADEAVSGVTLTVVGIGAGGNPGAETTVAVQSGGNCGGSPPFCGTATVDLSTPEMKDIRGTMEFRVSGQDAADNKGSTSAGLRVTRWRWMFDAGAGIFGTPAIGNRGTVYFGTSLNNNSGKTLALSPAGAKKWEAATGDVAGSVAVGALAANDEYVYVAGRASATASYLYALLGSNGTEKHKCQYNLADQLQGSIAVGSIKLGSESAETAAGIYEAGGNQTHVAGIRPDATVKCIDLLNTVNPVPVSVTGGAFAMKDQNIFYGTNGSPSTQVTSYDLASGSNTPRTPNWPVSTVDLARGLAVTGDNVYVASSGSSASAGNLATVGTAGGTLSPVYPPAGSSRVFNLAIGSNNTAYFGAETSTSAELVSLPLDTGSAVKVSAGTLRGAPIVGKSNRLYTFDTQGKATVWSVSPLAPIWSVDLALNLSAKDVSPTLDCRRDASGNAVAGLGSLYVAANARLYAFIIDDPGFDSGLSAWPKFQHDARNTGNPATPITNCP